MAELAPSKKRRLEWLLELIFGIALEPALSCPSCGWLHFRAGLTSIRLLAEGRAMRCVWCAAPMFRKKPQQ